MSARARLLALRPPALQRFGALMRPFEASSGMSKVDLSRGVQLLRPIDQALISGRAYQWQYECELMRFDPATKADVAVPHVDPVIAFNTFERGNTADRVAPGYEMGSLIALGWDCYPVGVTRLGHRLGLSYPGWPVPDGNGGTVWMFCEANPIDGICEAPEE